MLNPASKPSFGIKSSAVVWFPSFEFVVSLGGYTNSRVNSMASLPLGAPVEAQSLPGAVEGVDLGLVDRIRRFCH